MFRTLRAYVTVALILSVVTLPSPIFAATEGELSSHVAGAAQSSPTLRDQTSGLFSESAIANAMTPRVGVTPLWPSEGADVQEQRYFGRRGHGRRSAAITAIVLGSAAAITGGALLAYANRPDCGTSAMADGCSYGSKVIGGSVLAGGLVGVTLGVVMWPH